MRELLGSFIREFNRREWSVRIAKKYRSFQDYAENGYVHQYGFGTGFVVDGRPVPYFHPNRSFHDEIIWLNKNLYYDPKVSFLNRLMNSAVVKFYGPSRTLEIITDATGIPYIDFANRDPVYWELLRNNLTDAFALGEKIWGTTELRTTLQTAARDHCNQTRTPTKMQPFDMVWWLGSLSEAWSNFYRSKPDMRGSFEFLTSLRGVGNYYGYHLSSNFARMPGLGTYKLMNTDSGMINDEWDGHGNIDENADYVVAGPGAMATLKRLYPDERVNVKTAQDMILHIRNVQEKFFDIQDRESITHLNEATELGRFTTFGIEIGLCQFNVFCRLAEDERMARNRASAPISVEEGGEEKESLESFFG